MKKMNLRKWLAPSLMGAALISMAIVGCQKENLNPQLTSNAKPSGGSANCSDYSFTLDRTVDAFTTVFTWTVVNPIPGNGNNGTLQNLSHWTFVPGCASGNGLEANWDDILSASYSTDNGLTWIPILPVPELVVDPSQQCTNDPVFKFNQGTSGSAPTKYQLVLFGNYKSDNMTAWIKSGSNTGCCYKVIPGIGCKTEDNCSLSQGYYFAKPGPTWPGKVTIGGSEYTEDEGRAIWNCSNKGGIADSKKAFTQLAALKLSGANLTDAALAPDVATIEAYLGSLSKLVACTYLPSGGVAGTAAAQAAGRIGDWINNNHCPEGN